MQTRRTQQRPFFQTGLLHFMAALFLCASCGSSGKDGPTVSLPRDQASTNLKEPFGELTVGQQLLLERIETLLSRRQTESAIGSLTGLIEEHPRDLQLNALVAHAEWLNGDYDRAHERAGWVRTALEPFVHKNRDNTLARDVLSRVRMVLGDLSGSEVQLRIAIRKGRTSDMVLQRWMNLLIQRGNLADQLSLFDKTLGPDKARTKPHLCASRALALIELDKISTARSELQSCQKHAKEPYEQSVLLTALGLVALRSGDHSAAEDYLRKATKTDPSLADAHHVLGLVLWRTGRADDARASVAQALDIRKDPEYAYLMGLIHAQENQLNDAVSRLDEAMSHLELWGRKHSDRWRVPFLLGRVLARQKQYARAQQILEKAIQLEPNPVAHREIYRHLVWVRQKGGGGSR